MVSASTDAADRILEAAGEISALAGRMMPVGGNTSTANITFTSGGMVAIILCFAAILSCTVAAFVAVNARDETARMREELKELRDRVDVHDVYINTEFRRNQEKK